MALGSTLGTRIAELRRARNWKQERLAEVARVSVPFLSEIENDKRNPSADVLLRIANSLGASLDYLLRGDTHAGYSRAPLVIPPDLANAAEEQGWTYAQTETVLQARRLVVARRQSPESSNSSREFNKDDWIKFARRLFEHG